MRILTRGSALALVQAERMAAVLRESGCPVEIVPWTTRGDRDTDSPLCSFGGSGAFSGCIEEALLLGKGDGAVHSLKDIPSCCRPGLEIAAVLPRDSSADVLVCRENAVFDTLPEGASVGTSSPRRKAQILGIRPDLSVSNIREISPRGFKNSRTGSTTRSSSPGPDSTGLESARSTQAIFLFSLPPARGSSPWKPRRTHRSSR